jgi:hypothetical protein
MIHNVRIFLHCHNVVHILKINVDNKEVMQDQMVYVIIMEQAAH